MIQSIGQEVILVKDKISLNRCDGLIIPGGESTTFMNLINHLELFDHLVSFGRNNVIFGTCAGSIIISRDVLNETRFNTLNLINVTIERNAFGRQVDSFIDNIKLSKDFFEESLVFEGVFIRAPKIISLDKNLNVLATYKDEPVLVENENILLGTFHPELTNDPRIHNHFINKIKSRK